MKRSWRTAAAALGVFAALAAVAFARQDWRSSRGQFVGDRNLEPGQVSYDGRFVIGRVRFTVGGYGGFGRRGGGMRNPPWSHDYPNAERNFMKILKEITALDAYSGPEGGAIVDIGSKELFLHPIVYFCEPGYWTQSDQEAANLAAYLKKGGFIIFDDFRGNDWSNFEYQMKRVLPGVRFFELPVSHPIFHSFFDIGSLQFQQFYDRGQPYFYGVFEDNDPDKRLMAIVNYNNDVSEYWEWSDTGWEPIDLTNEAFKFGVNYVIYGMTH